MLRDDSDVRVLAIKARGEPFLPLPAKLPPQVFGIRSYGRS
jgi:hypothetical protein